MGYLDDHLLDGERVVHRARLHWTLFAQSIALAALGLAGAAVLYAYPVEWWWAALLLVGVAAILAVGPAIRRGTSEFAVTNKRVVMKTGLVQRDSHETLLGKVEAIGVDQGFLGRILDFGTITITGTGGTQERFAGIARPLEFRRQVQAQIVEMEERRGAVSAPAVGAGPQSLAGRREERECPHCAEPILVRAKVCKHCGLEVG